MSRTAIARIRRFAHSGLPSRPPAKTHSFATLRSTYAVPIIVERLSRRPLVLSGRICPAAIFTVAFATSPATALAQVRPLPEDAILQQSAGDRDPGDRFGHAVAVFLDRRIVVGAPSDDERGTDAGAVYVFDRREGAWHLTAKIAPASLQAGDGFGSEVAVATSDLLVGAPGDDRIHDDQGSRIGTAIDRGAAYIFTNTTGAWTLQTRLEPRLPANEPAGAPLPGPGDAYGSSVAISSGFRFLIGAPLTDGASADVGVVYALFDTPRGPATLLDNTDVAAVFDALTGPGIIVERALYRDAPARPFEARHESAGVTAAATDWYFAEGATSIMVDTFFLVANPTDSPAQVRATYLLDDGRTYARDMAVAANARTNIWADVESLDGGLTYPLSTAAFSTTISSTNGVPVIAERSMWWPGPTSDRWYEAHNSFGSTETGTVWLSAYGAALSGFPATSTTYLLISNPGLTEATVNITLLWTGPGAPQTYPPVPIIRETTSLVRLV